MDINGIPKAVMGIIAILIVIVSIAVPVFAGMDLSHSTTIGDYSGYRYAEMGPDDVVEIGYDSNELYIDINGERQTAVFYDNDNLNAKPLFNVIGENLILQTTNNGIRTVEYCYTGSTGGKYSNEIGPDSYTNPTTITYDSIGGSQILPGKIWIMVDDGDYVNVASVDDRTIPLSNAGIFAVGWDTNAVMIYLDGSEVLSYHQVEAGTVNNLKMDITITDNQITYPDMAVIDGNPFCPIFLILAPYEVGQKTATDKAIEDMIDILPLIMVIGVLIAAVGIFLHSRG